MSIKYPVVIVLHVLGEFGPGTPTSMCDFFKNRYQYFPYTRIEGQGMPWPSTLPTAPGVNTPFITLTPQFLVERYTPTNLGDFIEYVKATYNIDEKKIYLLGTSQGANVALQFIGKSESNTRSIAGVLALSPCYNISATDVQNIKNGGTPVWNMQCHNDKGCAN